MSKKHRSLDALISDIRAWIVRGRLNANGLNAKEFEVSKSSFDAGNWAVLCVGEASGKVLRHYPEFGDENLRKHLTAAYHTRNRIAHGYYDLDAEQIWETLEYSFPELLAALNAASTNEKKDD
jgi:uncharacterized protein with HEPN domain